MRPPRRSVSARFAALLVAAAPAQQSFDELPPEIGRSLREAVVEATYGVTDGEGTSLQALNPAQDLHSAFTPAGIRVSGQDEARGPWSVSLTLAAWGREGALHPVEPAEPAARGRRVEYRRGPLTEWYVNDPRGVEQGFTVDEWPAGEGQLEILLAIRGGLETEVDPGGRDARFVDRATSSVLHYSGLRAWDANGRELPASLAVEGKRLCIRVDDEHAAYPLHVDPWIATEEAKLTASDAGFDDEFGVSVSIDGNTAVVGAPSEDNSNIFNSGAAYVFVRNGSNWSEQQKLTPSDPGNSDKFGTSAAIADDTIVVGAPHPQEGPPTPNDAGAAYVFARSSGIWIEQQKLEDLDGIFDELFGTSVAISGDTAVVGASRDVLQGPGGPGRMGAAFVFVRNGAAWLQQSKLIATDPMHNDWFGHSVSISGDTALIGAAGRGSAFVFVRNATAWNEEAELFPSDGLLNFGESVAIDGDTAVIGRPDGSFGAGSAYAFVRSGTTWSEQQKLIPIDPVDGFGESVAIQGDTAVIGSPDCCSNPRSAHVFARSGATWTETLKIVSPGNNDEFGFSVALSGSTTLIGAYDDNHVQTGAGSAYVFHLSPPPVNYCTAGISVSGCQALLSASGTASASAASGFSLLAAGVEGAKDGLFFFGTNGRQANPWGNGTSYQCVVSPVKRAGLLAGSGTIGLCDGAFAQDLNALWCPTCPKPALNPGVGAIVQAQLWYRDPQSTSNQPTSLSDAIEFGLDP